MPRACSGKRTMPCTRPSARARTACRWRPFRRTRPRPSRRPLPRVEALSRDSYPITVGDGRSTEELVEAGGYGYAHSCVTSDNFPSRRLGSRLVREVVLVGFDREVTADAAIAAAAALALERPVYEDALYFGIEHPDVQRRHPVLFLHDPWLGFFGRRDVVCLWSNAGRRELGLEGFDDRWDPTYRFAFIDPSSRAVVETST